MADFYYPNRTAPTKTVTINYLEVMPSSRSKDILQSRDMTAGGDAVVYDLAVSIQYLVLAITHLEAADKVSLADFIDNYADGANNTFDFTDDEENEYDDCRFWFDDYDFKQNNKDLFSESLLIRVDV